MEYRGDSAVDRAPPSRVGGGSTALSRPRRLDDVLVVARRLGYLYLLALVVGAQLAAFVDLLVGLPISGRAGVWLVSAIWPVSCALVLLVALPRGAADAQTRPLVWLTPAGMIVWGAWAGSYYSVGHMIDPARVATLPEVVERHIPLIPSVSLAYVGVFPLSLVPVFRLANARELRLYLAGYLAILAASAVVWSLVPLATNRPDLAFQPGFFGVFVLDLIYSADPPTNCMPSTHCAMALFAAVTLWRTERRLGIWAILTAIAIGASTLLIKQHYLVDILAGYLLGGVAAWLVARRLRSAERLALAG